MDRINNQLQLTIYQPNSYLSAFIYLISSVDVLLFTYSTFPVTYMIFECRWPQNHGLVIRCEKKTNTQYSLTLSAAHTHSLFIQKWRIIFQPTIHKLLLVLLLFCITFVSLYTFKQPSNKVWMVWNVYS